MVHDRDDKVIQNRILEIASIIEITGDDNHPEQGKHQFILAEIYREEPDISPHDEASEGLYNKSAENGYADAQYFLADELEAIDDDQDNFDKIQKLYTSAAEQGHVKAQYALGSWHLDKAPYFEKGSIEAVTREIQGIDWLKKAFENGMKEAFYDLCEFHRQFSKKCNDGLCDEFTDKAAAIESTRQMQTVFELGNYLHTYRVEQMNGVDNVWAKNKK